MTFDAFITAERDGWDSRAAGYAQHTARATFQIIPAMLDALRLRPGDRLLETACGTGNLTAAADALDVQAEGSDYAPAMVAEAKRRFPGLTFTVADAENLPQEDNTFDAVACNMGLFHMGNPDQAIAEAARVLRPGGRFSFSQWTAPAQSELYGRLFKILTTHADMSRADPAPDAFALSEVGAASARLQAAGFGDVTHRVLPTSLIAKGNDFFEFFMAFGVRVPLIVAAQEADIQDLLRREINAAMASYRTSDGFEVPLPSLVYTGVKT